MFQDKVSRRGDARNSPFRRVSIKGIGPPAAAVFPAGIGDVNDFERADKLAAISASCPGSTAPTTPTIRDGSGTAEAPARRSSPPPASSSPLSTAPSGTAGPSRTSQTSNPSRDPLPLDNIHRRRKAMDYETAGAGQEEGRAPGPPSPRVAAEPRVSRAIVSCPELAEGDSRTSGSTRAGPAPNRPPAVRRGRRRSGRGCGAMRRGGGAGGRGVSGSGAGRSR